VVATFRTYAEVLRPDHVQVKAYEAGLTCRPPGLVLANVLARNGGVYETTLPFTPGMRSELRDVAEAGRVWLVFGRRLVMSGDRAARGTALAEAGRLGFGRPRFAVRPRS
jgi:hypothetical protein